MSQAPMATSAQPTPTGTYPWAFRCGPQAIPGRPVRTLGGGGA